MKHARGQGFSLIEVVLAIGIVSFSLVTTVGLLTVADSTQKRSADETIAVQIASNEFQRLAAISSRAGFPTTFAPTFYDAMMKPVASGSSEAVYEFRIEGTPIPDAPGLPSAKLLNAEVRFPAAAASPEVIKFVRLIPFPAE